MNAYEPRVALWIAVWRARTGFSKSGQVVDAEWILIPPWGGSYPPTPAKPRSRRGTSSREVRDETQRRAHSHHPCRQPAAPGGAARGLVTARERCRGGGPRGVAALFRCRDGEGPEGGRRRSAQ